MADLPELEDVGSLVLDDELSSESDFSLADNPDQLTLPLE